MSRLLGSFLSPVLVVVLLSSSVLAGAMSAEDAWKALPAYQYGKDIAALLAIDHEVIVAMATPEKRAACAARLAALLDAKDTTLAAKQYICCQLRQVGTAAEVPILARLLATSDTAEMARCVLESIPGEESVAVLRNALGTLQGRVLIGAINSVAVRKDAQSVAKLKELAQNNDPKVAAAAFWALGNIATPEAIEFVLDRASQTNTPMPVATAIPLLRCAKALAAVGKPAEAQVIYEKLAATGQAKGVRRAAIVSILDQEKERADTILAWIGSSDADRQAIAMSRLATLPDADLDRLAARLSALPVTTQLGLIEVMAARKGNAVLPFAMSLAGGDKPELRLAGIHLLGQLGDVSTVPLLVNCLADGGKTAEAARRSLCRLPREAVAKAMLDAIAKRPETRRSAIAVLTDLKYYEAIDPLVAIASQDSPAAYEPALEALRGIADPDDADLSRLLKLWSTVKGKHRDEVERTIFLVCQKLPDAANRDKPVLAILAKGDASEMPKCLPLLGRFGGPRVRELIEKSLADNSPEIKELGFIGLCNWPNAEVAEQLWTIATGGDKALQQQALRAYVRVVTVKSDRPPADTLAMLQKAMKEAKTVEDQQWVLHRAAAVRILETVEWLAGYLDDPNLNQTACQSIVELAHHRFLRHPNMNRFGPILEKVARTSKDASVVSRANKYRLGL